MEDPHPIGKSLNISFQWIDWLYRERRSISSENLYPENPDYRLGGWSHIHGESYTRLIGIYYMQSMNHGNTADHFGCGSEFSQQVQDRYR